MRRAPLLVAAALVLAWLTLTLTVFDDAFIFHGDHERDLRYVTLWVQHGHFPEASPAIAPFPFELGPLSYVLLAPAVAVSADPLHVRVWVLLLAAAGALVLFNTLRRRVRWEAAALALFGLLASTFWYEMSRQLWHSSLLPLPVALVLWSGARLLEAPRTRDAVLCAVAAAVTVQLHLTAAVYPALALGVAVTVRRRLGWRRVAIGVGVFLIALLPMLLTLARSLQRGALEALERGRGGPAYAPAEPLDVLEFLLDNLHTIWGDDVGPWLTWPWALAVVAGVAVAVRRRPFGWLLAANLLLGLVVEALLLGNQEAHRYMHANVYAAFGLGALALDAALRRLPARGLNAARAAAAVLVVAVMIEAALSPIPHYTGGGWLNAREQRAVAEIVAERHPMDEDAMERRIHGIYFGEWMGLGHYHALQDPGEGAPKAARHVLVMPADLALPAHGEVLERATVIAAGREIAIEAFEPALADVILRGPAAADLRRKWRRRQGGPSGPGGPAVHVLTARNTAPGAAHLALSDGRRDGDRCPVQATLSGRPVAVERVPSGAYRGLRAYRLPLPAPGGLAITIGPCPSLSWLDLW